ncbi:MAG: response regulator, partial [Planctomycetaceae bacterium]
ELALDTPLSAEQREYIEIARDSGESLLAIVNDILDFSKIEAGKEELRNEPFCFREELKAVVRSHRNRAELNGIQLACQVADEIPERLIGDRYKLRQLLNNLIGNAVKFTPSGSVCVTAAVYEQLAERIALHIEVADTGIGLPADQISKVFDPFCQADGSTTRRFGGTGLGLAISAQLAKLMGGTIWVASSPGEGSIFHFTAQFDVDTSHRTEAAKHSSAESRPQARSLRILLAEDHPINQKYASHLLQKHGHQVLIAENGRRAVEYYRTHPIDIILMDVQMPEMDGIEATGEIRSHERLTGRHCPVIALTAHATKEDRDRCLGVGMDGYLTKPISASELLPAIDDILRAQAVRDHKISPCEPQSADLDINAALELTDGDEALLKELIGLHQRHSPILLTEIREALQAGDCTAVERKAHTLKGTLGVLCANRSRHSAFALEEFASDRNIDGCNKVFCELIQGLTALEGLLAEATNGAV